MQDQSSRTVTIAIVTGIIALMLGACGGLAVGGLAGFALGRQSEARAVRSFEQPAAPLAPSPALPGSEAGVVVQGVVPGSPAADAGIQAGDVIVQIDDQPVDAANRLADILAAHRPGDRVQVTVQSLGRQHVLDVELGSYPGQDQRAYLGIRYSQPAGEPATPTP